jgi:hypothetical protein
MSLYWTEYTATVTVRFADGAPADKYTSRVKRATAKEAREAFARGAKNEFGDDCKVSVTGLKQLIWDRSG